MVCLANQVTRCLDLTNQSSEDIYVQWSFVHSARKSINGCRLKATFSTKLALDADDLSHCKHLQRHDRTSSYYTDLNDTLFKIVKQLVKELFLNCQRILCFLSEPGGKVVYVWIRATSVVRLIGRAEACRRPTEPGSTSELRVRVLQRLR